jgi:glycosyltransferase involved in cell wall biosynthesis
MRICIWYKLKQSPWGGSNSFLRALSREFSNLGHYVTDSPSRSDDVVLVNSWSRGKSRYLRVYQVSNIRSHGIPFHYGRFLPGFLKKLISSRGTPIIHRLDGVAQLYGRQDLLSDKTQFAVSKISDYSIFQSQYSEISFNRFGISPNNFVIIHNAVDSQIFHPQKRPNNIKLPLQMISVSWSPNPMKGFSWLPHFANFPNVELSFIGNWCPDVEPGNVKILGIKTTQEIAQLMRGSDVLVHMAENDPCPNVILEGLASGLPILYKHSGGNHELAGDYGIPVSEDFNKDIDEIHDRFPELRQKVLDANSTFLIEQCAINYLDIFQQAINLRKNE